MINVMLKSTKCTNTQDQQTFWKMILAIASPYASTYATIAKKFHMYSLKFLFHSFSY